VYFFFFDRKVVQAEVHPVSILSAFIQADFKINLLHTRFPKITWHSAAQARREMENWNITFSVFLVNIVHYTEARFWVQTAYTGRTIAFK